MDEVDDVSVPFMERRLKFIILLTLQIPSLVCTAFIFYHFKWRHIQTQIYGFLLIINVLITGIELSITLFFLYSGTIYETSRCNIWILINYSLFQLSIFFMTWTSIERYLFIYHDQIIRRYILLFHYIPVTVLYIFTPLLYIGLVLVYPCQQLFDVRLFLCGGPCYSFERGPGFYDWFTNSFAMQTIILVINIVLIVRHFIQRYRMKRMVITTDGRKQWRRSVRLASQLLGIALIYFIAWIPYTIVVLIQIFLNAEGLVHLLSSYLVYAPYIQSLLLPYVCILFMPEIKEAFMNLPIIRRNRERKVTPTESQTMRSIQQRTTTH